MVEDNATEAYLVFYQHADYLLDSADPNDGTVPAKHITPDPNAVARPKPRIQAPAEADAAKPAARPTIKLPMFRMSKPVTCDQIESSPEAGTFSSRLGMRTTKPQTPSQASKLENLKLR